MQAIVETAIKEARTSPALRRMSPRIQAHFDTIERRMHLRQKAWGGNLSVLDEETGKRPPIIRRSLGFERVMREMPIAIEPHDILVGSCLADDRVVRCAFPIFLKNEELGKCSIKASHKCPDYVTLLGKGLRRLIEDLEAKRPEAEAEPYEDVRREKLDFIEACIREAESVIHMANRYAGLAEEQAAAEVDEARKQELLEIAQVCRRVPEYPAQSLHEAIQSMWFGNYALFETMTNISIGNVDRVLDPYFRMDWEKGAITLERAQELVDSFCLHVNDRAQIDPEQYFLADQKQLEGGPQQHVIGYGNGFVTKLETDGSDAINHWGQNILLSGLCADGSDATGPLTYLFLNAHEKFSMTSPVLTVRMHKNSPPELYERVAQVLKTGGGMPYINNDDVIVSAYEQWRIPREDGCWYANSNCWETLIQGMSNQEMIRGLNFLYFLELALNRGEPFVYGDMVAHQAPPDRNDPMTFSPTVGPECPIIYGVDAGAPAEFETFEDLMGAWRVQLDSIMGHSMERVYAQIMRDGTHGPLSAIPFLSVLTRDCIQNLKDTCHLGARYTQWHLMAEAVSNAADAAMAIKKFVYDEKLLTLPALVELLKNNWAGPEGEQLRRRFTNDAPKFGNNHGEVDRIAAEMVDYFVERSERHAAKYKDVIFAPCIGTFSWIVSIGRRIGASADGRESQEAIAANMSPVPGRDISGPLPAIHSYLKLNTAAMATGAPIDLRVNMNGLEGEEGTARISALIKTFIEQGGNMMTLTITSAEELRRAMEQPERYRGLRVRMGGWSAYYVLLSKEAQKIHLRRVEHGLA